MQRLFSLGVVLTAGTLLANTAVCQQPPGGRRGGRGEATAMLSNKSVQTELKVTSEQDQKIKEFAQKMREKRAELQDKSGDERRAAMQEFAKETTAFIKSTLDEKQYARFRQIRLQQQAVNAFSDQEVVEKLKLTDDQKEKIKAVNDETREKLRGLTDMEAEERAKKRAEIVKEAMAKVEGILSADQKKTWKDIVGKPFEIKLERSA